MQLSAYAAGIQPSEFWAATVKELALFVEAHGQRLQSMQQLAAWHLAPIINIVSSAAGGKSRCTPQTLMGKARPVDFTQEAMTLRWLKMGDD